MHTGFLWGIAIPWRKGSICELINYMFVCLAYIVYVIRLYKQDFGTFMCLHAIILPEYYHILINVGFLGTLCLDFNAAYVLTLTLCTIRCASAFNIVDTTTLSPICRTSLIICKTLGFSGTRLPFDTV